MQVTINLESDVFEKLANKEIDNIPPETVQTILCEGIREYLLSEKGQKLFYQNGQGYYSNDKKPSRWLENIISKAEQTDVITEVLNTSLEKLQDNYENILIRAIGEMLAGSLFNSYIGKEVVKKSVLDGIMEAKGNKII